MQTKECKTCRVELSVLEFTKAYTRKDGTVLRAVHCKECKKRASRDRYSGDREYRLRCLGAAKKSTRKHAEKRRTYENSYRKNEGRWGMALRNSRGVASRGGHVACSATVGEIREAFTGKCQNPACMKPEIECNTRLHMDHDHETGEFRGWLCSDCNKGIGSFKDDVNLLAGAAEYLEYIHERENHGID